MGVCIFSPKIPPRCLPHLIPSPQRKKRLHTRGGSSRWPIGQLVSNIPCIFFSLSKLLTTTSNVFLIDSQIILSYHDVVAAWICQRSVRWSHSHSNDGMFFYILLVHKLRFSNWVNARIVDAHETVLETNKWFAQYQPIS